MNCAEFEDVVVAIARGELMDRDTHLEATAHAGVCLRCSRRLASERILNDAVAAVIAQDAVRQPSPFVGKMLLEGFHERQKSRRQRRRVWITRCAAGAIAAMLLIGTAMMLRRAPQPAAAAGAAPSAVATAETGDEVTTDFIPLSYDPAPVGATSVVRVELPRSALMAFGLPMNEDRMEEVVQADILLDEDGLMRAVRFVQ